MLKILIDLARNLLEGAVHSLLIFLLCVLSLALIMVVPVGIVSFVAWILCLVFSMEFNWSILVLVAFLSICLIATAKE